MSSGWLKCPHSFKREEAFFWQPLKAIFFQPFSNCTVMTVRVYFSQDCMAQLFSKEFSVLWKYSVKKRLWIDYMWDSVIGWEKSKASLHLHPYSAVAWCPALRCREDLALWHTQTDLKGREALEGEHKGELGGRGGVCFYHEGLSPSFFWTPPPRTRVKASHPWSNSLTVIQQSEGCWNSSICQQKVKRSVIRLTY